MNVYIWEDVPSKTYTIVWNETSDPSQFFVRYEDDAAWLTQWSTDFDTFFWYYGCRLSNAWAETSTVQQSSPWTLDITQLWTLTSWDNVMIAFPRRWIKISKSWTQVTLSITDAPNKEWYQYYAHTKGSDAKSKLYLWAYKMVSWYKSLSWAAPLANHTRTTFRSWVKSSYDSSAWTNRYSQITIYARWYINALYMMKYGNPNSQSVVWMWYVWGNAAVNTWGTNNQTSATYWTTSTTAQAKLFWIEDWRGNLFEFMDCCYFNENTQLTVDKTNSIFQDSDYATNLWTASSWYLKWIDWSNDGMFMNVANWWSDTTYYTDANYSGAATVPYAGWYWNNNTSAGVFYWSRTPVQNMADSMGSRLMYL